MILSIKVDGLLMVAERIFWYHWEGASIGLHRDGSLISFSMFERRSRCTGGFIDENVGNVSNLPLVSLSAY